LSLKYKREVSFSKLKDDEKGGKVTKKAKKVENTVVHNQCILVNTWKLLKEEESSFGRLFSYNTLLLCPDHESGCKLYHKWALKRYCFSDYNNKASHNKWSTSNKSSFDAFQKKARGL